MGLQFGDPVTNVCAGESNPHRHGFFVRRCNKLIEITDKRGSFWKTDHEVIFPGHLDIAKCEELFAPIWEKRFGKAAPWSES